MNLIVVGGKVLVGASVMVLVGTSVMVLFFGTSVEVVLLTSLGSLVWSEDSVSLSFFVCHKTRKALTAETATIERYTPTSV